MLQDVAVVVVGLVLVDAAMDVLAIVEANVMERVVDLVDLAALEVVQEAIYSQFINERE